MHGIQWTGWELDEAVISVVQTSNIYRSSSPKPLGEVIWIIELEEGIVPSPMRPNKEALQGRLITEALDGIYNLNNRNFNQWHWYKVIKSEPSKPIWCPWSEWTNKSLTEDNQLMQL